MSNKFRMLVGNIYRLPAGPVVTGYIDSGRVRVGDSLTLVGAQGDFPVRVVAIEKFRESLEEAQPSDEPVGITLAGVEPDQIQNRDLLVSDGAAPPTRPS